MREMQPKMRKSGRAVVNVTQLFDRLCSNDSDTEELFADARSVTTASWSGWNRLGSRKREGDW